MSECKNCRRRAVFYLTPNFIIDFLRSNEKFVFEVKGLPKDTKYCGTYFDYERDCFAIIVESKEFDCIPYCEKLPVIENIIITRKEIGD